MRKMQNGNQFKHAHTHIQTRPNHGPGQWFFPTVDTNRRFVVVEYKRNTNLDLLKISNVDVNKCVIRCCGDFIRACEIIK